MRIIWHGERRSETRRQDAGDAVTIQSDPLPGVAALAIGGAMLLEDASAAIVPVISMVGDTPPWRSPITSGSS
jgi:hypothetical protein